MALGDLATVKLHFEDARIIWECGLGMQCISPFTNWRDLLAAEFLATVVPEWMGVLSFYVGLHDITVSDVVPGTGADVVLDTHGTLEGSIAAREMSAATAVVISWRSDGIGRNTRGRNYISGIAYTGASDSQDWDGAVIADVISLGTVVMAQYGPTGFSDLGRLQVISRGPKSAPLAVPQAFPITHFFVDAHYGSMRKRLRL